MLRVLLLLLFQLAGGLPSDDPEGSRVFDGDPVDLNTGLYEYSNTDLRVSDIYSIELTRIYRNEDTRSRAFGIGANHMYEMFLVGDRERFSWIDLIDARGSRVHFERTSPGTSWENAEYIHTSSPSSFYGATLRWNRQWGGWEVLLKDGTLYEFPNSYAATRSAQAALIGIRTTAGNRVRLERNSESELVEIVSPRGRRVRLAYDSGHRIIRAEDDLRRVALYEYDDRGRLILFTGADGRKTRYTYDQAHRMITVQAEGGINITNQYDEKGRVVRQTRADGTFWAFQYSTNDRGRTVQTDVRSPEGRQRRVTFNEAGYILTDIQNLGSSQEETIIYEREPGTNQLLRSRRVYGKPKA